MNPVKMNDHKTKKSLNMFKNSGQHRSKDTDIWETRNILLNLMRKAFSKAICIELIIMKNAESYNTKTGFQRCVSYKQDY